MGLEGPGGSGRVWECLLLKGSGRVQDGSQKVRVSILEGP
jgi:hypothetical protein